MKRCLQCSATFSAPHWTCPHCSYTPGSAQHWPDFLPATMRASFPEASHEFIDGRADLNFWFRARRRLTLDILARHVPPPRHVLELGCGTGYTLAGLQKAYPSATFVASDFQEQALAIAAKSAGDKTDFIRVDAGNLPFISEFDLIVALDVIEHIENDVGALAQMHAALKPGGSLLVSVPQHPFLWSKADEFAGHFRRYRRGELSCKLRQSGFGIEFQTSFMTVLFPLMVAQRILSGSRKDYDPKHELNLNPYLDKCLGAALAAECALVRRGLVMPFGGSCFIAARKPSDLPGATAEMVDRE